MVNNHFVSIIIYTYIFLINKLLAVKQFLLKILFLIINRIDAITTYIFHHKNAIIVLVYE